MKKIFLFAALAGIVFASCQKEAPVAAVQDDGQQEVTFAAFSKAMTRGVLGNGTFADSRTIQVAGVMKTTDGKFVDFLEVTKFARATDGLWKAGVYYPIGAASGDFRFLAYSESSGDATYARWYGSKEVELQVAECAENEIVYSGFQGNKSGAANAAFKRTQALVTVDIKASASGDAGLIQINKIGFKDVKTSGTLILSINPKAASADAEHKWIFTAGCNCAFAEMNGRRLASGDATATLATDSEIDFKPVTASGDADALGYKLSETGFVLDRLFPAQTLETKTMVINYTLGDITTDVELALADATATSPGANVVTWKAGTRYVYEIKVHVNEIKINPESPDAWELNQVSGTYDN